jgi:hypothetical protein
MVTFKGIAPKRKSLGKRMQKVGRKLKEGKTHIMPEERTKGIRNP